MNVWDVAAIALMTGVLPLLWTAWRGSVVDSAIALQLTGVVVVLSLLLMTEGTADTSLIDPAVVLAMLAVGGALVFLHFYERWI